MASSLLLLPLTCGDQQCSRLDQSAGEAFRRGVEEVAARPGERAHRFVAVGEQEEGRRTTGRMVAGLVLRFQTQAPNNARRHELRRSSRRSRRLAPRRRNRPSRTLWSDGLLVPGRTKPVYYATRQRQTGKRFCHIGPLWRVLGTARRHCTTADRRYISRAGIPRARVYDGVQCLSVHAGQILAVNAFHAFIHVGKRLPYSALVCARPDPWLEAAGGICNAFVKGELGAGALRRIGDRGARW